MDSSPHEASNESAVALSSPPTPSVVSPPAGPSSPLLTLSDSPDPYLQSCHPVYLANYLQKLIDEREGEFRCSFGNLVETVERKKRENAEREGVIKFKRDSMVMLDNLIKMQEKEVENLETLVAHISPSAVEANGDQQLPGAPKLEVAKVGREVSKAGVTGKKAVKVERKISGAGSLSEEKVAKAGRKVSGAGDVPDKKTSKVVASEPREPRTKRLPVSTVHNTT